MNKFIEMIRKQYGFRVDVETIQEDTYMLSPDYMVVRISIEDENGQYGNKIEHQFVTSTLTEHVLKSKIWNMVSFLKSKNGHTGLDNYYRMSTSTSSKSIIITPVKPEPLIKKVIFNDPATIVFWKDGTKTVVKCQPGDMYDKMTGLAMACSKYMLGNKGNYYDIFKKWIGDDNET